MSPSTPFEQAILARLVELERDVEKLSGQADRLTWLIVAAFVGFVVMQLLNL